MQVMNAEREEKAEKAQDKTETAKQRNQKLKNSKCKDGTD